MTKPNIFRSILTILLLVLIHGYGISQSQTLTVGTYVEIHTTNGDVFKGKILEVTEDHVLLNNESIGEIKVNIDAISDVEGFAVDESGEQVVEQDYHNSTRNLISPTGFGLKKGQSYYQNAYFFLNTYSYGVTDNFSISIGGELISPLFASQIPGIVVSPKFSTEFAGGSVAIGTTILTLPAEDFVVVGLAFGAITFGDRNNNFTVGVNYGYSSEDGLTDTPLFNIGGMTRVSDRISLVSDNWFFSLDRDFTGVLSVGMRIHTKIAAIDLGLFRPAEDADGIFALPYFGVVVPIN